MEMKNHSQGHAKSSHNHYRHLLIMTVLSFIAMYGLMYSMVDVFANVIPNVNQFYMAGLMSMPMVIIELAVMGSMYKNKRLNMIIFFVSAVMLVGFFLCIRQQVMVKDKQFLKSMIPHHAAAILMVEKAQLSDPEIIKLGQNIIESQQKEIDFMKRKLAEIKK
jgi:hypothetical protein